MIGEAMSKSAHVTPGRSRPPSRSGTPIPQSRLLPPVLQSPPSLSNLRVYSYSRPASVAPTPISLTPPAMSGLLGESSSGASSALDLPAEGILVPEPDVEVDTADGENATATGTIDDPAADEEAKRHLREQLRRTLSHKTNEAQPAGGEIGSCMYALRVWLTACRCGAEVAAC